MMRKLLALLFLLLLPTASMADLTLRRDKGTTLTHDELDDNFAGEINQATHGMDVGDLVYRSSSTAWADAKGDAEATLAEGIVVDVEDTNNYSVATIDGTQVTITTHGFGATGTKLYLSQGTAALITATAPTSGLIQPIGSVIDTNTIRFSLGPLVEWVPPHCISIADPATDDEWYSIWYTDTAVTIRSIYCEVTGGTSVVLDLEIDDGAITGVNGSGITCNTSGVTDSTLGGDTAMASTNKMDLDMGTVTGTVTQLSVCWTMTRP